MPSNSSGSQDERENINVYKSASAAVVTVKSVYGSGAGCIIDPSGIVVTNKHVIGVTYNLQVKLADGTVYSASVLDVDNDDLALLKINANKPLPYIRLGDSSRIEVGQRVLAIGNPFGLERTLTTGIISRIDYNLNRIQTDAAINPGNSGGPLLDTRGELIGINQAILNPSGRSNSGIGFAIPSNTVKRLLAMSKNAKILSGPSKSVPQQGNNYSNSYNLFPKTTEKLPPVVYENNVFLGLAGKTLTDGQVVVLGVVPGSPAENAGIKFKDVVLAVDSVKVQNFDDIGFALKDKKPGDKINLLYMRNGVVNNSSAVLAPRN
ncbi:MAG: trypsin-like peptidase domain-containing protein [Cyanobacteriota bacterium]